MIDIVPARGIISAALLDDCVPVHPRGTGEGTVSMVTGVVASWVNVLVGVVGKAAGMADYPCDDAHCHWAGFASYSVEEVASNQRQKTQLSFNNQQSVFRH